MWLQIHSHRGPNSYHSSSDSSRPTVISAASRAVVGVKKSSAVASIAETASLSSGKRLRNSRARCCRARLARHGSIVGPPPDSDPHTKPATVAVRTPVAVGKQISPVNDGELGARPYPVGVYQLGRWALGDADLDAGLFERRCP